jgi:transcriptional regulator with XRE-family HTH domain
MADDDVKVLFGRRVRQLRKERGVSQEAFAHAVGIDRSYFGSIERGRRNVSLENIAAIAAGLGVPPAQLLMFDGLDEDVGDLPGEPPAPALHRRDRPGDGGRTRPSAGSPSRKPRPKPGSR